MQKAVCPWDQFELVSTDPSKRCWQRHVTLMQCALGTCFLDLLVEKCHLGKMQRPAPFAALWWGDTAGRVGEPPRWAGGAVAVFPRAMSAAMELIPCPMLCVTKRVCLGTLALADDPAAGL